MDLEPLNEGLCHPRRGATVEDIAYAHSLFFGETAQAQAVAKSICRECPVQFECLKGAMERNEPDGVWGGLSHKDRQALRKRLK